VVMRMFLLHPLPPYHFVLREHVEQLTWALVLTRNFDFWDGQTRKMLKPLLMQATA